MKKKENKLDLISGIVLVLISVFYLSQIGEIKVFESLGATPLTNRFVPYLWGALSVIFGLIIIGRSIFRSKNSNLTIDDEGVIEEGFYLKYREVILTFICITIYVALLDLIGFIIMTSVYTFCQIIILTPRADIKKNILPALIVSLISGVLIYVIFKLKLHVQLPSGIIPLN